MKPLYLTIGLTVFLFLSCKQQKEYIASGTFEATEVIVSAEGNGRLLHLDLWEGDLLTAGKAIGCIDTLQLYFSREQAIRSSKSVDFRRQDFSKQIAVLEQQIATQRRELTRFQELVKHRAASKKQVDDIEAQIKLLERQLEAQKSSISLGNLSVTEDKSGLDVKIEQIDDMILKSIVCSPITGTVLAKYAQAGEYATVGKPLFKVADMSNVFLRAYITADQLAEIKLGQRVKLRRDPVEGEERLYDGTVSWVSEKAEFTPKTILTRNERANSVYAVKIAVENDGYLKIGMYGEVVSLSE